MELRQLEPNQIITLNDYPVHSNTILEKYFASATAGNQLPYVPIIATSIVREYLDDSLQKKLDQFENVNPEAQYIMLDGSHRTTALTLTKKSIKVIVYQTTKDIIEAKKLVASNKVCQNGTLDETIEENCKELNRHFRSKPYFMTVADKTQRMVDDGILPVHIRPEKVN